jgi:hypothetical protein
MKKEICDKTLSFEDCELAILRQAVDKAEEVQGEKKISSAETKKIITIIETFIKKKDVICYGGTAINNILPKQDQFYNKDIEMPDYDFYSSNALEDAKELANIYYESGFIEVEAKAGQHHGTYKVFVNFTPVADITYMPKELFQAVKRDGIRVGGILYAPPNLLRMGMYLELSRPDGDVSRWEKVLKRLALLNKHYPLKGKECLHIDFQRKMGTGDSDSYDKKTTEEIYETVKRTFMEQDVVFFGGYALSMYSQYMPKNLQHKLEKIPDFDVLSEDPLLTAQIVKERLLDVGIKDVKIIKRPGIGEIIAPNYEIKIGRDAVAFIYEPLACHSYNEIKEDGYEVKIATIDTILSFYLAFLYANRPYYDVDRILCMSIFLFDVQEKNRLTQNGLLKRFSLSCMGHQTTVEEMRSEKSKKFMELKDKKDKSEYDEWFLRYRPDEKKQAKKSKKSITHKVKEPTKSKSKSKKRFIIF